MPKFVHKSQLASLARESRKGAGITKIEAAKLLGVKRPSIQLAEEAPEQSLDGLRIRMIETCSNCRLEGPFYKLVRSPKKPR